MKREKEAYRVLKRIAKINKADFKTSCSLDLMKDSDNINLNELTNEEDKKTSKMSEICYPRANFCKISFLFVLWNCLSMN